MHIITQKRVWEAKIKFPESRTALDGWYRLVKRNSFNNFAELKGCFNSVDKVKNFYVFDIGGNKLRVIAIIHFQREKLYVKAILTHQEYDRENWK